MQGAEHVQEWLQVHRHLIDLENAFTDLAIRAAHGEVSEKKLEEERALLIATREICSAAYQRAFPNATRR